MGVATGCGCKEVYRFPHTTYPYSSCICSFLQQHPFFFFIFKMFFVLCKIATINLSIPVSTASVERSFSQMKLIKTRLRSSLNDKSLSHLMKIAIESPAEITDSHLEEVVDVWNRKNRKIAV